MNSHAITITTNDAIVLIIDLRGAQNIIAEIPVSPVNAATCQKESTYMLFIAMLLRSYSQIPNSVKMPFSSNFRSTAKPVYPQFTWSGSALECTVKPSAVASKSTFDSVSNAAHFSFCVILVVLVCLEIRTFLVVPWIDFVACRASLDMQYLQYLVK